MAEPSPELWWARGPADPRAVVLMLHGGAENGTRRPRRYDPAVLRARVVGEAVARAGSDDGLRVEMLRYRMLGWNEGSSVSDARWALDDLARRFPGTPIGVFGHSMGGRTALLVLDDPRLRAVVTAATWVELRDLPAIRPHAGLDALLLHGAWDRITSRRGSLLAADHLRALGARVALIDDIRDGHGMLLRARTWHRTASEFLRDALGPAAARPPMAPEPGPRGGRKSRRADSNR
ncbi:MAG: alpha/beta hydrolase [Thermoleophilia bacterium]|nr:alpha/beta hydrolase [Thermoleophilia bacterium]